MTFKNSIIASLLSLCASVSAMAAIDISGVKVEEKITLEGTTLQLNGAGIRYKAIFKVYVGELHTSKKVSSLEELIAAPGPKRLTMTFLRDVDSSTFGKMLTDGVADNQPKNQMSKLVPALIRLGGEFASAKPLKKGDVVSIDWIPGLGMFNVVNGTRTGEAYKDPEVFKAIMSIWFGPSPADFKLKEALLGQK